MRFEDVRNLATQEIAESTNNTERVRRIINGHAEEQAAVLAGLEEEIATVGSRLDDLKRAREALANSLRGTEKLRASMNGDPYEDNDATAAKPAEGQGQRFRY